MIVVKAKRSSYIEHVNKFGVGITNESVMYIMYR